MVTFYSGLGLNLPLEGKLGSKITWESDKEYLLTSTGKVTRPEFGKGNRKVTLKATITYGQVSDIREFEVTILEMEPDFKIVDVEKAYVKCKPGCAPLLPSVVIVKKDDGTYGISDVSGMILISHVCQEGQFEVRLSGIDDQRQLSMLL